MAEASHIAEQSLRYGVMVGGVGFEAKSTRCSSYVRINSFLSAVNILEHPAGPKIQTAAAVVSLVNDD